MLTVVGTHSLIFRPLTSSAPHWLFGTNDKNRLVSCTWFLDSNCYLLDQVLYLAGAGAMSGTRSDGTSLTHLFLHACTYRCIPAAAAAAVVMCYLLLTIGGGGSSRER